MEGHDSKYFARVHSSSVYFTDARTGINNAECWGPITHEEDQNLGPEDEEAPVFEPLAEAPNVTVKV